ncbi:MAG: hypothetical protein PHH22_01030 [Clostridia bacterium]|nr:hypothetical protein [Clostridia bacterium]
MCKSKKKRGSEVIQVLLVAAIFLVLVCTVFYSAISGLLTDVTKDVTDWYDNNSSVIFAATA